MSAVAINEENIKFEMPEQNKEFSKLYLIALPPYNEWKTSFVAGNDTYNICEVEVGSGFYVEFKGKIYLRGIVSSAGRGEEFDCSKHSNAIFTDVPEYFKPVDRQQSQSLNEKDNFIEFSEANFLVKEPVCR